MRTVRLASEIDFEGFRTACRSLRHERVAPELATFSVGADLFGCEETQSSTAAAPLAVPRAYAELARRVVLHREPGRFALLYRLLCRLEREPRLLEVFIDPDVHAARMLEKAVDRAAHKMKAFVRFREVETDDGEAFAAWFEPAQRVVEATAPFFARRFANQRFSIFTPESSAHWDGEALSFTGGSDRTAAPDQDPLEAAWRAYYGAVFNPARANPRVMAGEMPKKYWRNLPEASDIPRLLAEAPDRVAAMAAQAPTTPRKRTGEAKAVRGFQPGPVVDTGDDPAADLEALRAALPGCRRCGLWRCATRAVAGEGGANAKLMLVGEQPGDQEDLAGRPFVGPAGQLLDRALAEAEVPRSEIYITNAVKHFKHEPRGKRRLHKTPDRGEVQACRNWLLDERRLVAPKVVLALGATAGLAVFGQPVGVSAERGRLHARSDGSTDLITTHPAYLLRLPDAAAREAAYRAFVEDLRLAGAAAGLDGSKENSLEPPKSAHPREGGDPVFP